MTINYYLDDASARKETAIYIYVRIGKNTIKINTGEKIASKFWDVHDQKAKRSYVGSPEFNEYLNKKRSDILRIYRIQNTENSVFSYEEFRQSIADLFVYKSTVDSHKEFFRIFEKFLEARSAETSNATLKKFRSLRTHLQQFQTSKKYRLSFDRMTLDFHQKFTSYLIKERQLTNNSIGYYTKMLKTFLRWALDRKLTSNEEYRKFRVLNEMAEVTYLNENELMRLLSLDLSKQKRLEKVRDVFCIGVFTGQRYSDLASLQPGDVKNKTWYLRTQKTKDILEIPLNEFALDLLKKYSDETDGLPVISNQKMNTYLKELGKLADISESISRVRYRGAERIEIQEPKYEFMSMHMARRTFVTLSLEKGMRPETVMEITGHKNYATFKKYIKITSTVKRNEMNAVWSKKAMKKSR